MLVNRRSAIKQFLFISAGVVLIPSCMQDKSKSAILLRNMSIDADQEKLLEELSETIIPKTSTPGAKDVSAHLFVLKMLDDCYKKEDQEKFIRGLGQFEDLAKKKLSHSFLKSTVEERESLLNDIENRKEQNEDLAFFYYNVKSLTIRGYTTSQYYLTNVQVYELVPSRYHGCVPVSKANKKTSTN
jgi:hypothetical protein